MMMMMMMMMVVVVIMRTRMTDSWYGGGGGINCCDDTSCYYDRYDCDDYRKDESMYHKSHPKVEGTKEKMITHTHTLPYY